MNKEVKFNEIVDILNERTIIRMEEEGVTAADWDSDEDEFWIKEAKAYVDGKEEDWEILLEYCPI